MNFALSDEQQMIVDTVRTFVENELYPHEEEVERTGVVPKELGEEIAQKVRDIGFLRAQHIHRVWRRRLESARVHLAGKRVGASIDGALGILRSTVRNS